MKKQAPRSALGTLCVLAAACGWGTWALFLRGRSIAPAWQSTMILAVIALVWLAPALRSRRPRRDGAAWFGLLLVALTDAGNYLCYFGALDRGPIALAVLTHYLAPVVVALLAPAMLGEKLTARTLACLSLSLAGLALLVFTGATGGAALSTALFGAGSALFYGVNLLLCKKLFDRFSVAELLSYHCAVAALLVALFAGPPPPLRAFLWTPICGALLAGALGGALYYQGLKWIPASRASVLTYLEPCVAAAVGAGFFGEPLGAAGMCGGALIVLAGAGIALAPETGAAEPEGGARAERAGEIGEALERGE